MKTKKTRRSGLIGKVILLAFIAGLVVSCGKDDDGPDERTPFLGTYTVDTFNVYSGDLTDTYDITISNGSGKDVNIDHFGFFKVPIRGTVSGNNLTIPSQTFTQDGITIEVSGSGKLENDVLTYTYTLTGFSNYSVNCIGTKK